MANAQDSKRLPDLSNPHKLTASLLFEIPYDEVTERQRAIAKMLYLGMHGLHTKLSWKQMVKSDPGLQPIHDLMTWIREQRKKPAEKLLADGTAPVRTPQSLLRNTAPTYWMAVLGVDFAAGPVEAVPQEDGGSVLDVSWKPVLHMEGDGYEFTPTFRDCPSKPGLHTSFEREFMYLIHEDSGVVARFVAEARRIGNARAIANHRQRMADLMLHVGEPR